MAEEVNLNGKHNLSNSVLQCVPWVVVQPLVEAEEKEAKAGMEHQAMNLKSSTMIESLVLIAEENLLNLQLKDISPIVRPQLRKMLCVWELEVQEEDENSDTRIASVFLHVYIIYS